MRYLLFLMVFLLIPLSVSAALEDEQYIVVVGASAPASDVVIAANFVASMKATLGVTFVSALDTDAAKLSGYAGKTIVVIDGRKREVRIFGTSNAAAAANTYFARQGFDVESGSTAEDVEVKKQEIPPPAKPIKPVNITVDATADLSVPELVNVTLNTTAVVAPETPPAALPPAEPPAQEQPGFLKKVWRWFSSWF